MTALTSVQGADELGALEALTDGFSAAFVGAAAIAAVGGLIALVPLRKPPAVPPATDEPPHAAEPVGV